MNTKVEAIEVLLNGELTTSQQVRTIGIIVDSESAQERSKIFEQLIKDGNVAKKKLQKFASIILLDDDESDWDDDANNGQAGKASETETVEQKVTRRLHELGVPAHIKGYKYLREAIKLGIDDTSILERVTKTLYPTVAKKFDTTPSRVERAIRHAIEVVWSKHGDVDYMEKYFGFSVDPNKGKPTNSEFIATLVDWIRLN